MPGPQRTIGGTGFTSLGDYVGANGAALDAQYNQDASDASGIKNSYESYLGMLPADAEAEAKASGIASNAPEGSPDLVPAYANAVDIENRIAPNEISTLGLRTGGGSGANPVSGEDSFNAALQKGAHGSDYSTLASSLGGTGVGSIQKGGAAGAWQNGSVLGAEEYKPPNTAPGPDPLPSDPDTGNGGSSNPGGGGGIGPGSTGGGQGGGVGGGGAPPGDWNPGRRPYDE